MQVPDTDDQCPGDRCPAVPPQVPPTCAQQCTHLCHSAVSHTCAQKCHLPVPRSATYLCPEVPPTCAHPPVPTSATHLCPPTCAH
ncbi:unnamed protein product, partial [Staurois parvus]